MTAILDNLDVVIAATKERLSMRLNRSVGQHKGHLSRLVAKHHAWVDRLPSTMQHTETMERTNG